MENRTYPYYRKLNNGKVFYFIADDKTFIERQRMGEKLLEFKVVATQYPEMLRIQDMINCHEDTYLGSNQKEWEAV